MFYKSNWEIVGASVCDMVQGILRDPSRVEVLNETLIFLVPKVEHVVHMKQLRPISLCNVSYKIVSNVLASRLRCVMDQMVGPR